ncbi:MAG TPA: hypothetical protein VGV38_22240 [Pyrinomonadaceae bacterium]|nr:hypothetical protein [Pyrinomonadaceae bacterium]
MRTKSYLLAAALLLAAHVSAAAQPGVELWYKLAPPGQGFSALTPTRAAHESQTNPADSRMKMEIYTSEGEGRFFYISSLNFAGLFQPSAANFESFVKGFLESFCGTQRQAGLNCETPFERDLTLGGHRGRQFKVVTSGQSVRVEGVLRIYMTQKHFYALQALGAREGDAVIDKFLRSFAITQAAPARAR